MSTMTEEQVTDDLVNVSDLESLWDETPPLCQVTYSGVECGKPAVWFFRCMCAHCGHVGSIVVCAPCHDMIIRPGIRTECNICHLPMNQEWKPL
jgi:hypothetical protein